MTCQLAMSVRCSERTHGQTMQLMADLLALITLGYQRGRADVFFAGDLGTKVLYL